MKSKRVLQAVFSALFILFLLVLVYRFKPKVNVSSPAIPATSKAGAKAGSLSASGFHFTRETAGKTDYEVSAATVTEAANGVKKLTSPVLFLPGQGRVTGELGSFDLATKTVRIWKNARLTGLSGWSVSASAFRLTPEGEISSEGPVLLRRDKTMGSAEQFRYNRISRVAHLEGDVKLKQGSSRFACRAIAMDFKSHSGRITGPVNVKSGKNTIIAPGGVLLIDEKNRLKGLELGSPVSGDGPAAAYEAEKTSMLMKAGGALEVMHLTGKVSVHVKGKNPATLKSERLDLVPTHSGRWKWTSPGALTVSRLKERISATSGEGAFGGGRPLAAHLNGPVAGGNGEGVFSGGEALLAGRDWTLKRHAKATTSTRTILADRIVLRGDDSSSASGHVSGVEKTKGGEDLTFTSDKAAASKKGYPARLNGAVEAERGQMTLSAPSLLISGPNTMVAKRGGRLRFKDKDGTIESVRGNVLAYDGAKHVATATGDARGEGRGHWITAHFLRAILDNRNRPTAYEAEGSCRFNGSRYSGLAERLYYNPWKREGRAESNDGYAVVTRKKPFMRVTGRIIVFGKNKLAVYHPGSGEERGRIEGAPGHGKSGNSREKKTDGH